MYDDTDVLRRRADLLREQAVDIRALADQLVVQTESIGWTGRAADRCACGSPSAPPTSAAPRKHGLLTRSIELDADALVLRATVLSYRWIDELQTAAYETLGSIAGRAIGYLAPQVALGGAIVTAGLIETDALDRDGVAAYLNELADANPGSWST